MLRTIILLFAFLSSTGQADTTVELNLGYTGLDLNGLNNYIIKGGMGEFRSALGADTDNMIYGVQAWTNIKSFSIGADFNYLAEETAKTVASQDRRAAISGWWFNFQAGIDRRSDLFGITAMATLGTGKLNLTLAESQFTESLTSEFAKAYLESKPTGEVGIKLSPYAHIGDENALVTGFTFGYIASFTKSKWQHEGDEINELPEIGIDAFYISWNIGASF